jgi:triacylglycerol esterase/lipase EstA (alpha/beta hydrolase family)
MRTRVFVASLGLVSCLGGVVAPAAAGAAQAPERDPVIIVAGTGAAPVPGVPDVMAERLTADGYDVTLFYLPNLGLGQVEDTSAALPPVVDQVLARTGAAKVDLVGHSQGGIVSRYYIKFLGGAGKVDSLVSLAAPHYGSQLANLVSLFGAWDCLGFSACTQATVGSPFLAALNGDDDTFGTVAYTNIVTRYDLLVVPYTNGFQRHGATNVTVQDQCPRRPVGHLTLVRDAAVYGGIVDALAKRPVTLDCAAA